MAVVTMKPVFTELNLQLMPVREGNGLKEFYRQLFGRDPLPEQCDFAAVQISRILKVIKSVDDSAKVMAFFNLGEESKNNEIPDTTSEYVYVRTALHELRTNHAEELGILYGESLGFTLCDLYEDNKSLRERNQQLESTTIDLKGENHDFRELADKYQQELEDCQQKLSKCQQELAECQRSFIAHNQLVARQTAECDALLAQPIAYLKLDETTNSILEGINIKTVGELANHTATYLMEETDMECLRLIGIIEALARVGLFLPAQQPATE